MGELTLDELCAVEHVVLTHSHLDHIAALPLMADSVLKLRHRQGRPPVMVHALPPTLAALQLHVFNNVIWPDFTRLPTAERPVLRLQPLQVGQRLSLGGLTLEALPASHTVPAVGYAIWPGDPNTHACWVFTGDTGPNPSLWEVLSRHRVAQLVIETAFEDADHDLAHKSQHLHPQALLHELQRFSSPAQVYITHMKPGDAQAVEQDMARLGLLHKVTLLQGGEHIPLGA